MHPQEAAEDRLQADLTQARLRLGHPDLNTPCGELDILSAKSRELVGTQAGED